MAINLDHQRDKLSTTSQLLTLNTTGALVLPSGTTVQATSTIEGQLRYDTDKTKLQQYINGAWSSVSTKENLSELEDVTLVTPGGGAEYLRYNGTKIENIALTLNELHDVNTTTGLQNGTVLKYDSSNTFKPYVLELNDLSDVSVVGTPAQGKVLETDVNGTFKLADPFTNATFDARFNLKDTSDLQEGSNLYYTDERVDDRVATLIQSGTGFQTIYDDLQNKLTASVTLGAFTTSDLIEGANQYFTPSRADARISAASLTLLGDVDTVTSNDDDKFLKYDHTNTKFVWSTVPAAYTSTNFDTDFGNKDTDDLSEGTTNLYYTPTRFNNAFSSKKLNELNDVSVPSTPSAGQVLKWNNSGYWEAGTDTAITIGTGPGQAMAGNTTLYTSTSFDTDFNAKTTDNLSEGTTNKYASNANVRTKLSGTNPIIYNTTTGVIGWNGDTDDVPEGTTNKYYSSTLFDADFNNKSTDDLPEGSTNKYYSNTLVDARIALTGLADLSDVDSVDSSKDNYVLTYDHANTKFEWLNPYSTEEFLVDFANKDTDSLTEGDDNLYFTPARADARIGAASLGDLYDVNTIGAIDGQILRWASGTSSWILSSDAGSTSGGSQGYGFLKGLEDVNVGNPGSSQDGLHLVWNNNTSRFIFGSGVQAQGPTQMVSVVSGKLALNGNSQQTIRIYKGFLYHFIQEDTSNVDNNIYISTSPTGGPVTTAMVGTTSVNNSTSVSGSGTAFTTEISVGDYLVLSGGDRAKVIQRTDNTTLQVDKAIGDGTSQTLSKIPSNLPVVGEYTSGISSSGTVGSGSIDTAFDLLFNVPMDAPVKLYYHSRINPSIGGTLNVDIEGGNAYQQITVTDNSGSGGTGSSSGAQLVAASSADTLTLIAGDNVSIVNSQSGGGDDQITISSTGATGTTSTLGTPADTTFHDGAYLQKNQAYSSGTPLSGFDTSGTVTEAFDAVNEVMLNIRNDTYVRHADFTATPLTGNAPLAVTFTSTSQYNANQYIWDFGDGNTATTSTPTTTHTYAVADQGNSPFTVELEAKCTTALTSGSEGSFAKFKRTDYVVVYAPTPIPSLYASDSTIDSGSSTRYYVQNTQYATTWMIDFGDGTVYPTGANATDPTGSSNTAWANISSVTYIDHTYTVSLDTRFTPILYVYGPAAGTDGTGEIVNQTRSNYMNVYIAPSLTFNSTTATGTSDEASDNVVAGYSNTEGWRVAFTPTVPNMGTWGHASYEYDWGDLKTTVTGITLATAEVQNNAWVVLTPSTITVTDGSIFSNGDQILFRDVAGTTQINGRKIYVGVSGNTLTLYNQTGLTSYYNNSSWSAYTSGGTATSSFYQITDYGTSAAGTPSQAVEHFYKHTTNTGANETYTCKLYVDNGHTSAPISDTITITVKADPRADFTGVTVNDSVGHTNYSSQQIGFEFIGYDANDYSLFTFADASVNANTYAWDLDGGTTTASTQNVTNHNYAAGTYTVKLEASGPNSKTTGSVPGRSGTFVDDTEIKTNYIEIKVAPTAPANMTGKTMSLSSVGTSPKLCSDTTNNTSSSVTAGTDVVRVTNSTVQLGELSDYVNKIASNGSTTATLIANINGAGDGTIQLNATNQTNATNGSLTITADVDANTLTVHKPNIPENFYRVIKAQVEKTSTPAGYNEFKITHSDSSESNTTSFVQDPVTDAPTIAGTWTVSQVSAGTLRTMSSIPFYRSSAIIKVSGVTVSNFTGEAYRHNGNIQIEDVNYGNGLSDDMFSPKTYSYVDVGLTNPPPKNVGVSSAHALSDLNINMTGGNTLGTGYFRIFAQNCNGDGSKVNSTQPIHFWHDSPTLDETAIPNNMSSLGSAVSGAANAKRIDYNWPTNTDTPDYSSNASSDFYSTYAWSSLSAVINRAEAVCYLNEIKHMLDDFSSYLPVGPNLSTGRGSGTQYFTFAFKRNAIAKFQIKLSGEVTSLFIAIPGYTTDSTSTLNGWLDCSTNFGGAGFPGADLNAGGNGSNGVRNLGGVTEQGTFAVNTNANDQTCNVQLGTANTGSTTHKVVLVRFGIAVNKKVTALSIEDY